jgi:lipopolysaccharide transport system ATP-binding protein
MKVKGRMASLLEVGTGFHPDLSGRDNIFLNGAILGMRKKEIQKKFDEIVDFSGVQGYIDTPVKRYSSGMYVRLAFAVAAHLESEILIVDEVLAVGDAEFQKKCMGKMSDMSKAEGRTVLFVSHNLPAVKRLCTSALYLSNGRLHYDGGVNEAVAQYFNEIKNNAEGLSDFKNREGNGKVRLINMELLSTQPIEVNNPLHFRLTLNKPIEKSKLIISFTLRDFEHQMLSYFVSDETLVSIADHENPYTSVIDIHIGHFTFRAGKYNVRIMIHDGDTSRENTCDIVESAFEIDAIGSDYFKSGKLLRSHDPTALLDGKFEFK